MIYHAKQAIIFRKQSKQYTNLSRGLKSVTGRLVMAYKTDRLNNEMEELTLTLMDCLKNNNLIRVIKLNINIKIGRRNHRTF